MAYSVIPALGSTTGPCAGECRHTDCAESKRMAETICHVCEKRIGYGVKFCLFGSGLAHWLCALQKSKSEVV